MQSFPEGLKAKDPDSEGYFRGIWLPSVRAAAEGKQWGGVSDGADLRRSCFLALTSKLRPPNAWTF